MLTFRMGSYGNGIAVIDGGSGAEIRYHASGRKDGLATAALAEIGPVIDRSAPGTEQLKGWWESPEITAARKIGEKYAKLTVVAINGVPQ